MSEDLSDLFMQARGHGLVDLCTLDGGTYSCTILVAFECREMKAKSGFGHLTPSAAVKAAIKVAATLATTAGAAPTTPQSITRTRQLHLA